MSENVYSEMITPHKTPNKQTNKQTNKNMQPSTKRVMSPFE